MAPKDQFHSPLKVSLTPATGEFHLEDRFYMVIRTRLLIREGHFLPALSKSGNPILEASSRVVFTTQEEAGRCAEALTRKNPDAVYVVLEATHLVRMGKTIPHVTALREKIEHGSN